ncbi:tyrosine-type recombinase/integrase [Pseudorhodoferax soli]|uniref:Uncharacterized protein DUF4102 n=1 Tax=Pseudorhodoferax soli TaxID=545864 RepID=A0A368XBC7_9BURK|nr:integrase family protein [Pseudorhodoferax soli]RCW65165.1 uncharacterized protein DUF4102 [Pseudorhodoferax soli]
MPLLTVRAIEALKPQAKPFKVLLDRGLHLRVAIDGVRTLLVRYTVKGSTDERQYRLPQPYGDGPGQIRLAAACAEALRIRSLARDGVDWPAQEEARLKAEAALRAKAEREVGLTVKDAVREYVDKKRRAKDGLALKARTKADYLAMVEPGGKSSKGRKFNDGLLFPVAHKLLSSLTPEDIRGVYQLQLKRSEREATYAMQVLRAVLRWHGVLIPNSPLSIETAGRDRIILAPPRGKPAPLPAEKLGAWWLAACAFDRVAADYYRFQLLTGCRGVEIHGDKRYEYQPIKVGDLNVGAASITLVDTKNRTDHKLLLSRQALEIAKRCANGRKPDEPLFEVVDARKTLARINAAAGTEVQGHGLRSTFASIAEEIVSGGVLKRVLNHTVSNDVTLGHYVGKGEAQLRAGWQVVSDYIEAAAQAELAARTDASALVTTA